MKGTLLAVIFIGMTFLSFAQVQEGAMAPEISLPGPKDSIIRLSSFRGSVVLVDFWASWCGPCRSSNPAIVRLYQRFKGKGFEVLGVSVDHNKKEWLKAIVQDHITFPQVMDKAGSNPRVASLYGVHHIPTSFLLDKTGKVIAINLEGKHLENKIGELLQ